MDANAALTELRELITQWEAAGSRGRWTEAQADRAIELARDLDGWITRGGALPMAWRPRPDRGAAQAAARYADRPAGRNPRPIF